MFWIEVRMQGLFRLVTSNLLSLVGAAVATASGLLILILLGVDWLGEEATLYQGILTYLALPGVFVAGLLMILVGGWLQKRRGKTENRLPVVDLNSPNVRATLLAIFVLSSVNIVILSLATYKGVEVLESNTFCGAACHSVMSPWAVAYADSNHSNASCVSCHVGPGARSFVKAKFNGVSQVLHVVLNSYPRPIPSAHSLRSARETCEACHRSDRQVGDRLRVITHHQEDETSTAVHTVLNMQVGGGGPSGASGIHWHADPGVRIRYRSGESKAVIGDIELTLADGTQKLFRAAEDAPAEEPDSEWREMDCIDCHNRPSHSFRLPGHEIDRALQDGRLEISLPYIRREGVRLLREASYTDADAAETGFPRSLRRFYESEYPETLADDPDAIDSSGEVLADIWARNIFPEMKIAWGTYPEHMGHEDSPGCFRCHDDEHSTEGGETISQDCFMCHAMLAVEEEDPEILQALAP
jgi:hypothetical protein